MLRKLLSIRDIASHPLQPTLVIYQHIDTVHRGAPQHNPPHPILLQEGQLEHRILRTIISIPCAVSLCNIMCNITFYYFFNIIANITFHIICNIFYFSLFILLNVSFIVVYYHLLHIHVNLFIDVVLFWAKMSFRINKVRVSPSFKKNLWDEMSWQMLWY